MTDPRTLALHAHPELRHLVDLAGWTWLPPPRDDGGHVTEIHGVRTWPGGWADAIRVRYTTDAMAVRCDHAGGLVWSRDGGIDHVVEGLLSLPAPDDPRAPRLVTGHAP